MYFLCRFNKLFRTLLVYLVPSAGALDITLERTSALLEARQTVPSAAVVAPLSLTCVARVLFFILSIG